MDNTGQKVEARQEGIAALKSTGARYKKNGRGRAAAGIIIGLAAVLCLFIGYMVGFYAKTYPGLRLSDTPVGGLHADELAVRVAEIRAARCDGLAIILRADDKLLTWPLADFAKASLDEATVHKIMEYGRTGNLFERVSSIISAFLYGNEIGFELEAEDAYVDGILSRLKEQFEVEPEDYEYRLSGGRVYISGGTPGVRFKNPDELAGLIRRNITALRSLDARLELEQYDAAPPDLERIEREVGAHPRDAFYQRIDDKIVVASHKDGFLFDVEAARKILEKEGPWIIPVQTVAAAVTSGELERKLFRDQLATVETELQYYPSRTGNVRTASNYVNGTILMPGETFSFNDTVGIRTVERGFGMAGVYRNGQQVDDVGGGICQVSTNLYMAVLRARLEVAERKCHMFTVTYAPLGQDATVAYGDIDFRFANNTDYPLLIEAGVQEDKISWVKFHGTLDDPALEQRTEVTFLTNTLATYNFSTREQEDPELPAGQNVLVFAGRPGFKAETFRIITLDGAETSRELISESRYQPFTQVYRIGTGPSAQPADPGENGQPGQPVTDPPQEQNPPAEIPADAQETRDGGVPDDQTPIYTGDPSAPGE